MKRNDRNIRKTVKRVKQGIMLTRLAYKRPHVTLFVTQKFDKKGSLWFLSDKYSTCNQDLLITDEAMVVYHNIKKGTFLKFLGRCTIIDDEKVLKRIYKKDLISYVKQRKEKTLTAIKFDIKRADFWDSLNRKIKTVYEDNFIP